MIIGTRGSDLALTQARFVAALLAARGVESRLEIIKTQGDQVQHLAFDKMVGKGFFTKEIEAALLAGSVDLAVHSLKDLPTEGPAELCIAAIPAREDPRDCLLVAKGRQVPDGVHLPLPRGARVGTSAVRRRAQLLALRPDLEVQDLRGNVPTRVQRLREGKYDAILLACAGLRRLQLDLGDLHVVELAPELLVPAPAQGALGLQTRSADADSRAIVAGLHHEADAVCVQAEREVLARLQGGCHVPLGAHATRRDGALHMVLFWQDARATVSAADAPSLVRAATGAMGLA